MGFEAARGAAPWEAQEHGLRGCARSGTVGGRRPARGRPIPPSPDRRPGARAPAQSRPGLAGG